MSFIVQKDFSVCFSFVFIYLFLFQDDDWNNLVKKLHIANDEITLDQFLELHKLEAKNGESVELWMALWTMGYNHNLQRDESFDFQVS